MADQTLTFALGGVTPIEDGTVTISNLAGVPIAKSIPRASIWINPRIFVIYI
jgi:hypothetical protein